MIAQDFSSRSSTTLPGRFTKGMKGILKRRLKILSSAIRMCTTVLSNKGIWDTCAYVCCNTLRIRRETNTYESTSRYFVRQYCRNAIFLSNHILFAPFTIEICSLTRSSVLLADLLQSPVINSIASLSLQVGRP